MADNRSILIVVDTNRPDQVECKPLLEAISKVCVVDHHRRAADYINPVVVNLHETYASSASELVTELLVYSVEEKNNPRIFEAARAIAKQRGLRLYAVIGGDPFKLRKFGCDRIFSFASVPCFLRLMIGADFVVASSFHGTVFSLNFNKEFVSILPDRFSVRQRSLEVLFPSIAGRVKGLDPFDPAALSPLDYGEINRRLGELRASSEARLKEILTDI